MHAGLLTLLRLQYRATGRNLFRGVRTVRGALFCVLGIAVFGLWLAPNLWLAFASRAPAVDPSNFRVVFPLALVAFAMLNNIATKAQRGIHFTPAETDFLFCGPFTRRQLLLYKIASGAMGQLFASTVMAIVFIRYTTHWIMGCGGFLLSFLFMQLVAMASTLLVEAIGARFHTRARKAVLLVVGVAAATVALPLVAEGHAFDPLKIAKTIAESPIGSVVLIPFSAFAMTITAESWSTFAQWAPVGCAVDLALLLLVMRLDVNFLETEIAVSRTFYRRVQQFRRSGGRANLGEAKSFGRLPAFPWLAGAGPLVRRQTLRAMRSVAGLVRMLIVFGIVAGVSYGTIPHDANAMVGAVAAQMAMLTIMLTNLLSFDFRSDVDHIDWLKTLPLPPAILVAGQLAVPALMASTLHLAILTAVGCAVPDAVGQLAVAAAFVVPFNILLFAVENFIFLVAPARQELGTAGSFQAFGRNLVEMFCKFAFLAIDIGLALGAGYVVFMLTRESWVATFATAWCVLTISALAMLPCVAWAFRRFDVSVDTPA
jgi:hypothetical protein